MISEQPRRRWFRPRYSLATLFVVVTVVAVVASLYPRGATIAPGKVEKTDAFTRFENIESVELESWLNREHLTCVVPKAEWAAAAALFENGIRFDCRESLEAQAHLRIRADGKLHKWSVFYLSDAELILLTAGDGGEYWRGISLPAVAQFMRRNGTPTK